MSAMTSAAASARPATVAGGAARSAIPRTTPRTARPAVRPVAGAPALRLVPQRRSSAARAPFVITIVSLLVLGLLGLLLLNTMVNQQSFRLHDLARQGQALDQHEQDLQNAVLSRSAPGELARRAAQLGMLPGGPPAFLRLPDGTILGATGPAATRPPAPPKPRATQPPVARKPVAGSTTRSNR